MKETGARIAERLLARPKGATMDELIAATGGPQYNVLRRLAAQGYAVRKVRDGRVTRYHATPPARPSFEIEVSAKGQLTLPKALRERLGVGNGGTVRYTLQEDGRAFVEAPKRSIREMFGMLHRPGIRPVTVEEMNEGIGNAVAEDYLRSVGRRR